MAPPPRYEEWLRYVFDREVATPEWYWELEEGEFAASPGELVALVIATFRRCATDLRRFSDDQVGLGLDYILNNACSNVPFAIVEAPVEQRVEAIRALATLYSGCFEPRCIPALGHLSEPGASTRLGFICYMLWDVSPVAHLGQGPDAPRVGEAMLEVLEGALALGNIACVESALHGLGHMHSGLAPRVNDIIARAMPRIRDERLRQYARAASSGCVL